MLTALTTRIWPYLAAIGAALAAIGAVFLRGRRAGIDAARARAAEDAQRQRTARDEIDRSVDRDPDPMQRLRDEWRRP